MLMKRKFDGFARGADPRGGVLSESAAAALAERVFGFVTEEPGRLLLVAGVLDHVVADEELLLACAGALEVPPERITQAWRRLGPPDPGEFGA
jgi:Protein of unknown function (DUF3572)